MFNWGSPALCTPTVPLIADIKPVALAMLAAAAPSVVWEPCHANFTACACDGCCGKILHATWPASLGTVPDTSLLLTPLPTSLATEDSTAARKAATLC